MKMVVTILGCGTSVGSPMVGQQDKPQFRNLKNWRMRASLLIEPFGRGGPAILIDTSPDLRQQALQFFPKKPRLDAILVTHEHADHLHGLDDIRPFNFYQKAALPLYADGPVCDQIRTKFAYIFHPLQEGGGLPRLTVHAIDPKEPFTLRNAADPRLHNFEIIPLPLRHGNMDCLGFRIGKMAYLTDTNFIPDATLEKMKNLDVLILDCLRPQPHSTHFTLEESLAYAQRIKAKKTILTHMASELEYESLRKQLPRGIIPAYDGLQFRL